MKKITLLAVACVAISLASCKKDRTCTCTNTSTQPDYYGPGVSTKTETTIYKESKKDEARLYCLGVKNDYDYYDYSVTPAVKKTATYSSECELK
jgi:hypothetical protein